MLKQIMARRWSTPPSRRRFLEGGSIILLSACTPGCSATPNPGAQKLPKKLPQSPPRVDIKSIPMEFGPLPGTCPLVLPMTKGPCTGEANQRLRQDLREEWPGLNMYLGLRIIDASCKPVKGAQVSVWHTNYLGSYSGQTPANDFCVFDPSYLEQNFFRGQQISDATGQVRFLTCYPGWYPGRAVHIHLQVTHANHKSMATQLYFPSAYTDALFSSHPLYLKKGAADTTNTKDSILSRASPLQQQALTLDLKNEPEVGLVALKTVSIVDPVA